MILLYMLTGVNSRYCRRSIRINSIPCLPGERLTPAENQERNQSGDYDAEAAAAKTPSVAATSLKHIYNNNNNNNADDYEEEYGDDNDNDEMDGEDNNKGGNDVSNMRSTIALDRRQNDSERQHLTFRPAFIPQR